MNSFRNLFNGKPIIGMIHLSGQDNNRINNAMQEVAVYEEEGIDGIIVENYHGNIEDVEATLQRLTRHPTKMVVGVNILPNSFDISLSLAREYGAKFIQLDHAAGQYRQGRLQSAMYDRCRKEHPEIVVLGGVWPKYYTPLDGSDIVSDIRTGMSRADAIVVTGAGTGKETPLDKIKTFRSVLGNYPLIIGAGLTPENAQEQMPLADGAIVGSAFKPHGDTYAPVDRMLVRAFMEKINKRNV